MFDVIDDCVLVFGEVQCCYQCEYLDFEYCFDFVEEMQDLFFEIYFVWMFVFIVVFGLFF